jgi:hypothetical protein
LAIIQEAKSTKKKGILMAFCGNCGSELAKKVAFCTSCGKAVNSTEPEAIPEVTPDQPILSKPKKSINRTIIIAGAAAVAVIVVVLAIVLSPKPISLTKSSAQQALMKPSDFSISVSEPDDPKTVMDDITWVVFSAGDSECTEDGKIKNLIQEKGKLLASTDLNGDNVYFNEDIIEFDSDKTPGEIVKLVRSGYDNSACDYDSDTVATTFSDFGTAKEKLGAGTENSTYYAENSDWSATDWDFLSSKSSSAVVADGKYLILLRLSAYSNALSISEQNDFLTEALKKIYK